MTGRDSALVVRMEESDSRHGPAAAQPSEMLLISLASVHKNAPACLSEPPLLPSRMSQLNQAMTLLCKQSAPAYLTLRLHLSPLVSQDGKSRKLSKRELAKKLRSGVVSKSA